MATYQEQIANAQRAKEAKAKAEAERVSQELNSDQVKNWRGVLASMIGPYAHVMPEEMVRQFHAAFRDRLKAESSTSSALSPTGDNQP